MADRPRVIGAMEDIDGVPVVLSLNFDGTVRIHIGEMFVREPQDGAVADLDKGAREEFMRLWCEAERQAEAGDG